MRKITIILSVLILSFFLITGSDVFAEEAAVDESSSVQAEQADTAVPDDIQKAIETAADETLKEEQTPEEVKIDTEVKAEDLEVKEARVLPDNFLYGFKNMFRGIKSAFTFDPVKKAEYQLKVSNEKMVEAKQLIEQKKTDKAKEIASKVIESANKDFNKIANQGEKLKKLKEKKGLQVNKFLDKVADHSLKQQVLLQRLEEQVPEQSFARIEKARQQHLERFGEVMNKVADNQEEIRDRFAKVVENRDGSDFKEMKAIEILRDLEDKASGEQKEALKLAQKAIGRKFEQRMATIPPEIRKEKMQKYVEFLPGNAVRQFEAYDIMKQNFESPGMVEEMELAKDRAIGKFENQFANLQEEESRQRFMEPWRNGDPEDLRTMTELRMRLEPPELAQDPTKGIYQQFEPFKQEAEMKFRQRFEENPDSFKNDPALRRMKENPDIVDLKFSQDLNQIMRRPEGQQNPDAENFVREFQDGTRQKFIDNIGRPLPDKDPNIPYLYGPPVPGGLEVLQEIKDKLPSSAQQGINKAINAQTEMIERHMENTDDPAMFQRFEKQIENNSEIKEEMRIRRGAGFFNQMDERSLKMEKVKQEREDQRWQKMQEINQQMFGSESGESGGKPENMPDGVRNIQPEMKSKIEEFRKARLYQNKALQLQRPEDRRPVDRQRDVNKPLERKPISPPERPIIPLPGSEGFKGAPGAPPKPEDINPPPTGQPLPQTEVKPPQSEPIKEIQPPPPPVEPIREILQNLLGAVSQAFKIQY